MHKLLTALSLVLLAFTGPNPSMPFVDLPVGSPGYAQIDQLYNEGYVSGQDATHFGPTKTMDRASIAVLIVRAEHGTSFTPPAAVGLYPDVPVGEWYAKWVEQATNDGYMGPKWGDNFVPSAAATRSDVAVLLALGFGY
jgi:hypothetical protein